VIHMQQVRTEEQLRGAFGCFPSGVAAVCALVDGTPVGMAVSSLTSVSIEPALVSVCIQRSSATWPVLRERTRLGLSVLSEDHNEACRRLASKDGDRFAGVDWDAGAGRSLFIRGSSAWMEVSVFAEVEAGDHVIALLEVHGLDTAPDTPPLIFHGSRFRRMAAT